VRTRSFNPAVYRDLPTLRSLLSCRSRSWSVPSELSLPGEPHPLSRAVSSLGFVFRLPPAQSQQELHDRFRLFAPARLPFLRAHLAADPGRMSRDEGSLRSLGRSPRRASAPHVPSPSHRHWARRLAAGTPLRSFAPPGSPFGHRPHSQARLRPHRRCSPGILTLQSSLHHGSGFGFSRRRTWGACAPSSRTPSGAQPSRLHAATWTPTPGFANPGSVDTQESIETRASPSSGDPAHGTLRERPCASHQPRPRPFGR